MSETRRYLVGMDGREIIVRADNRTCLCQEQIVLAGLKMLPATGRTREILGNVS